MPAKNQSAKSPAPDVAREYSRDGAEHIYTLPSGVRVKLCPISASLIDEVSTRVPDPEVPLWYNKEYVTDEYPLGRPEENPNDPGYQKQLREVARQRGKAAMDAMAMFGVELIDGLPQDDTWIRKLRRLGLDLSAYDLTDQFDLEYLYKRLVVVDAGMMNKITELSGITPADVEAAERPFPRNT